MGVCSLWDQIISDFVLVEDFQVKQRPSVNTICNKHVASVKLIYVSSGQSVPVAQQALKGTTAL